MVYAARRWYGAICLYLHPLLNAELGSNRLRSFDVNLCASSVCIGRGRQQSSAFDNCF